MRTASVIFLSTLFFGFFVCSITGRTLEVFSSTPLPTNSSVKAYLNLPLIVGTFEGKLIFKSNNSLAPPLQICIQANYEIPHSLSDWNIVSCIYYAQIYLHQAPYSPTEAPNTPPPPTLPPTDHPTVTPTHPPTVAPTHPPTVAPTHPPTVAPTHSPTDAPTHSPTDAPTHSPSDAPTRPPTHIPTDAPTLSPTHPPTTHAPTHAPTQPPTDTPTHPPTIAPTHFPTSTPTHLPTAPTHTPTDIPISNPTLAPTIATSNSGSIRHFLDLEEDFYHSANFTLNLPFTGLETNYSIGVGYLYQNETLHHINISMYFIVETCMQTNYIPPLCTESEIEIAPNNNTLILVKKTTGTYLKTTLNSYVEKLSLKLAPEQLSIITIFASFGSIPTTTSHQYLSVNNLLEIPIPAPGVWHFFVIADVDVHVTPNLTLPECDLKFDMLGSNCSINVTNIQTDPGDANLITAPQGETVYFKVTTLEDHPLNLYVGLLPYANYPPEVLVREGNLPDLTGQDNDANGCTFDSKKCYVTRIVLAPLKPGTRHYFVAIRNKNESESTYAIWVDANCANNCTEPENYSCDSEFGLCSCRSQALDLNFYCAPLSESPLAVELIVLIIIAILVVLSAAIGFIAWAYMRRKRTLYDTVQ